MQFKVVVDIITTNIKLILNMDAETKKEFEKLATGFNGLAGKVDNLTTGFNGLTEKVDNLATGFGGLTKDIQDLTVIVKESFDAMDVRMDTLENKVDVLDTRMDTLENKVDVLDNKVGTLDNRMNTLENKVDNLASKMDAGFASIRAELRSINERLDALEISVKKLSRAETEDIGVADKDLEEIKTRVARIEQQMKMQSA